MASDAPAYRAVACTLLIAGMVAAAARLFARLLLPAVSSSKSSSTPPPDSNVVAHVPCDADRSSPQNEAAPPIFLSYSWSQMDFVKKLYDALVCAGHSPFFDRKTMPIAVQLSENINRCARECRLGVVVLSSEYVTSKWPMLELLIMTKTPDVQIYPLFYGLTVDDLKDQRKLSEWKRQWRKLAAKDKSIDVREWENAVTFVADQIGAVFAPKTLETVYIRDIVEAINKKIRPLIAYDVSYVKGHERLIEVILCIFPARFILVETSKEDEALVSTL